MDFSARTDGNRSLWCRLGTLALLMFASFSAHASAYGPPYNYNTPYGTKGGFASVDAAVNSSIADYETDCTDGTLTCRTHTFSITYGGSNTGTAATIIITRIADDGSSHRDLFADIFAADVTGSGFQPKNAGGPMTTGG